LPSGVASGQSTCVDGGHALKEGAAKPHSHRQ
jgi:hypothetical protein